ncbi:TetR/AcrR family transcriptional regulator [Actinomadura macrotermitis]|uniref:HTH tetR-type domain-containing protein n=1 Tax=Actinomadura macrotermitis TaxID=2585200 RepID=A0A7K0C5J2_9ACTN|nr:TetR/AcrR family transcriptional regulator [Actinomadura macrotermitis]MQY08094.1 hypothetical protein [Actinomadura macrotermitis]
MNDPDKASAPRQRLLDTAVRLFYAEGVHAVGVDRLVTEAGVTRATFYRHFPTKNDLVLAYVAHHDRVIRTIVTADVQGKAPDEALTAIFTGLSAYACSPGFRGCPFINVAAEYPDPADPVRAAVGAHRAWLRGTLHDLLAAAGHQEPAVAAQTLLSLRDGILVGGYLDDPATVGAAIRQAVQATLAAPPRA